MTVFLSRTAGLRELLSRLFRWRVGVRWYLAALLPAPLLSAPVLYALSLTSPIFTAPDKTAILLTAVTAGLTTVFEEIGWTGFATPRLRRRYGVVMTGLIVGVVWGAWHLLQGLWVGDVHVGTGGRDVDRRGCGGVVQRRTGVVATAPEDVLIAVRASSGLAGDTSLTEFVAGFLAFYFFVLPDYRVLMVWLYDQTASLLLAMLMHAVLSASTLVLQPVSIHGQSAWNVLLGAAHTR